MATNIVPLILLCRKGKLTLKWEAEDGSEVKEFDVFDFPGGGFQWPCIIWIAAFAICSCMHALCR